MVAVLEEGVEVDGVAEADGEAEGVAVPDMDAVQTQMQTQCRMLWRMPWPREISMGSCWVMQWV